jgi:hypothetical protein
MNDDELISKSIEGVSELISHSELFVLQALGWTILAGNGCIKTAKSSRAEALVMVRRWFKVILETWS